MLKETVTYEDFDGNMVSEDCYFNLSKSQLLELDARHQPKGWGAYLQETVNKNDPNALMDLFIDFLRMTYGIRDMETNRFHQSDEIFEDFQQTLAYDKFFSDLFMVEGKLDNFVKSVMPKDLQAAINNRTGLEVESKTPILENTRRESSAASRESVAEKLANDIRSGNITNVSPEETPEQKRARLQKELDDLK